MSRTNDIVSVLPVTTGTALYPQGGTLSGLAEGQLGVFSAASGLSIDATTPNLDKFREIFLALGVGTPVGGVVPKVRKSAGDVIQTRQIKGYTYQSVSARQPKILKVFPGTKAECDQDYILKVEFRNGELYRTQGFNAFSKLYGVKTACCTDCDICFSGDTNEITMMMVTAINADNEDLLTASAFANTAIPKAMVTGLAADLAADAPMTDADLQAVIEYNATQTDVANKFFSYFTIESGALGLSNYCAINLQYFYLRETDILGSIVEGFNCSNATIEVMQELAHSEGSGYDIQDQEYHAMGFDGESVYRVSPTTGLAKQGIEYLTVKTSEYNQINLSYANSFMGETRDYSFHGNRTTIAIPVADAAMRDDLVTVLDGITGNLGFSPLIDDVAATSDVATVVEAIPATTEVDGVSE